LAVIKSRQLVGYQRIGVRLLEEAKFLVCSEQTKNGKRPAPYPKGIGALSSQVMCRDVCVWVV
jgi:hypothetical protein